jgi:peptidoglycan/LPS O-acetylase OafA/YrhL
VLFTISIRDFLVFDDNKYKHHQEKVMDLKKSGYIAGIDGMRAIAVLSVIIYHIGPFPFWSGGFAGVDVFFVISGFVISKSLYASGGNKLLSYIGGFYKRRLVRILPALLMMLLVTTLLSVLFIPSAWIGRTIDATGLSSFLGFGNFTLAFNNDNYFSPSVELNPFLHTWSLAVEEQFYLIFPVLFYFMLKSDNGGKTMRRLSFLPLALLASASLLYCVWETSHNSKNAYFLLPSRFWELAAGALLFRILASGRLRIKNRVVPALLQSTGMALLLYGFVFGDQNAFPFPWALPAVFGTLILMWGIVEAEGKPFFISRVLSSRGSSIIGKMSYSLYLWHWPLLVLFRWTIGIESVWMKAICLVLILGFSAASYFFVESPLRTNRYIKSKANWKVVAVSLSVLAVAFGGASLLIANKSVVSLSKTKNSFIWRSGIYAADGPREPITDNPDILGHRLFAFGDSHTAAYRTMLNIVSKELGMEIRLFEAGGCAVAGLLVPMEEIPGGEENYRASLSAIRELARPGDVILLASLRTPEFGDQTEAVHIDEVIAGFLSEESAEKRRLALEDAKRIVGDLTEMGLKVVFEAPLPVVPAPVYRCSDWFNKMNPIAANGTSISYSKLKMIWQPVYDSIQELRTSFPEMTVWNPSAVLCKRDVFSAYDAQGKPIFWDGDHLSANGNRILAPSFREHLTGLFVKPDSE